MLFFDVDYLGLFVNYLAALWAGVRLDPALSASGCVFA